MSREVYGRLGSGRRSSGPAIIQWLVIGSIFGFGCGLVLFFGLLILGFVGIDPTGSGLIGSTPTAVVVVVSTTPDPNAPTPEPIIITATQGEAPTQESVIILPSPTIPVTEAPTTGAEAPASTAETVPPTDGAALPATPADSGTSGTTGNTAVDTGSSTTGIPPQLEGIGSTLVFVDGGTFIMGTTQERLAGAVRACIDSGSSCETSYGEDALPPHNVTISAFQIEETEVSYAQYVAFLNYLQSIERNHINGCGTGGLAQPCADTTTENTNAHIRYDTANYDVIPPFYEDYPMVNVTWYGAEAYCRALGRRLPTEAEWEWAARGTLDTEYPWGNDWDATYANAGKPATSEVEEGPEPVGSYSDTPSAFGAYNMVGNVGEWVADWYSGGIYAQQFAAGTVIDPVGPERGTAKVVRGGNWADHPFFARSVHRQFANPITPQPDEVQPVLIGFRCAADLEQPASSLETTGGNTGGVTTPFVTTEGTPDPASLGIIAATPTGNSAPGLPTAASTATDIPAVPPGG